MSRHDHRDSDRARERAVTQRDTPVEGGSAQYSVRLATRPGGDVTVTIAGHGGTDVTLSDESLVFTSEDWDIAQEVTLSAAHDDDAFDESVVLVLSGADGRRRLRRGGR